MIALVDIDALCFVSSMETLEESKGVFDHRLYNLLCDVEADSYLCLLSKGPYFRKIVNPEYKGNRTLEDPRYRAALKQHCIDAHGGIIVQGAEADDLVAFYKNIYREDAIVCSSDKDVLYQIPGTHYDTYYKNNHHVTVTRTEALNFLAVQTLMGDSTDNIKGIPRVGKVKAKKMLEGITDRRELFLKCLEEYLKHHKATGHSIFEFQKNFRQVYLLRTPEDFTAEGLEVPVTILEPNKLDFFDKS